MRQTLISFPGRATSTAKPSSVKYQWFYNHSIIQTHKKLKYHRKKPTNKHLIVVIFIRSYF